MIEKGVINYTIDTKTKKTTVIMEDEEQVGIANKQKGRVYVKKLGIIVGLLKIIGIDGDNIEKIVDIIRLDLRNKKGYNKNI